MSDQNLSETPLHDCPEDRIEQIVEGALAFDDLEVREKYLADALWNESETIVKSVQEILKAVRLEQDHGASLGSLAKLLRKDALQALERATAETTPPKRNRGTDENLLFGIIALQMDFIDRDQLITAMNTWVLEKSKQLGEILCDQKVMSQDVHSLLNGLVEKHLAMHEDDPAKSLASLSSIGSVRNDLQEIDDSDVEASLASVSASCDVYDPDKTIPRSLGSATKAGGRFQILRTHASGGLGEVFLANDSELNREVALKEIKLRYASNKEHRNRFVLEAEITGGLEHPGVVPVYGLGHYSDGRPFYAMRFIRGDNLHEEIKRFHESVARARWNSLELRKLLSRFVDVCNAIAYAHSRGVLHRDLKPGNVMLGKYGETLVVDWGLAKSVGRPEACFDSGESTLRPSSGSGATPTQSGHAIGTPAYMSPEQAAGRVEEIGVGSDVYNLGATLYHLLVGRAPHSGSSIESTLNAIRKGVFPAPRQAEPAVPKALNAICLKAMALRPADRYESVSVLGDDVENWLAGEVVTAYDEPVLDRVKRFVRHHNAISASLAVLCLCLCLAGVASLIVWQQIQQRETKRIFTLQVTSEKEERTAIHEMQSRRFAEAKEHLTHAISAIEDEPELIALRNRLELRLGRASQLARFHRLGEEAEEAVFFGSATEPVQYLQEALNSLGVFEHGDWWAHLPDDELTAGQSDRLRNDVYRRLVLLSALRVKQVAYRQSARTFLAVLAPRIEVQSRRLGESVGRFGESVRHVAILMNSLCPRPIRRLVAAKPPTLDASLSSAVITGRMARRFRSAQSLELGRNYCQFLLGENYEQLRVPKWETQNATDSYVISSVLLDVFQRMPSIISTPLQALRVSEPVEKARTMLRDASHHEPDNYWVHILLGKCEEELNKFDSARDACGRCISIDPDNWLGYMRRAQVSLAEVQKLDKDQKASRDQKTTNDRRTWLLEQSRRDVERARELQPYLAEVHWYLGDALLAQSDQADQVAKAYTQAIELETPIHELNDLWLVRARERRLQGVEDFAAALCKQPAPNPDYLVLLALVKLALGQSDEAFNAAESALSSRSEDARALAVRATVKYQRGQLADAISDFRKAPDYPLALLGKGNAFEKQREYVEALESYNNLLRVARTSWRKADAHLSRCRVLIRLGRENEALQAVEQALEINLAADTRELWNLAHTKGAKSLVQRLNKQHKNMQPVMPADAQIHSIPLLNSDFELGVARYWSVWENRSRCQSMARASSQVRRDSGKTSLYLENRAQGSPDAIGFMSQSVLVEPNETYQLTAWAKSEGFSNGGLAIYVDEQRVLDFRDITSTWTQYREDFVVRSDIAEPKLVEVRIQLEDEGRIWLDDLAIMK